MSKPLTLILENSTKERIFELRDVFQNDIEYQTFPGSLHHQGKEKHVVKQKIAEAIFKEDFDVPVVVDVSSLCFNALNGLPGTSISRFCKELNSKELYKIFQSFEDKSACVKYTLGLLEDEDAELKLFQGVLHGSIVEPEEQAKGWEACFQPDGFSAPFSELPNYVQSEISVRKSALRGLKSYLIHQRILTNFGLVFID